MKIRRLSFVSFCTCVCIYVHAHKHVYIYIYIKYSVAFSLSIPLHLYFIVRVQRNPFSLSSCVTNAQRAERMHHVRFFMEIGLHARRLNAEKLLLALVCLSEFLSPFCRCYTPYARNLVWPESTRRICSINYNGSFVLWVVHCRWNRLHSAPGRIINLLLSMIVSWD